MPIIATLLLSLNFSTLLTILNAQQSTVETYNQNEGFSDELLTPELAKQLLSTFNQVIDRYNSEKTSLWPRITKISLVKLTSIRRTQDTQTKFEGFFLLECNKANVVRKFIKFLKKGYVYNR